MKILRNGKKRTKLCPTCDCFFEYDVSEIQHVNGLSCFSKGTDVVYCPNCNERLSENSGMPVNIFGHLKLR